MEFAVDDLGAPPCPLTWLALGSLGRREVVPSSDVDSALVWDGGDTPELQQYMRTLGSRVVNGLAASGFVADTHGATAAHSLFDRSFDAWRSEIRDSIANPDRDKALIFVSLLSDARPVYEIGDARDPLEELSQAWHRPTLLRLMLRLALAHRPPTGFAGSHISPGGVVDHAPASTGGSSTSSAAACSRSSVSPATRASRPGSARLPHGRA